VFGGDVSRAVSGWHSGSSVAIGDLSRADWRGAWPLSGFAAQSVDRLVRSRRLLECALRASGA